MTKRIVQTLCGAVAVIALAGCNNQMSSSLLSTKITGPKNKQQVCNKLKREMLFYENDPNVSASYMAPSQKERIKQLYRENGCK